MQLLEDRFDLLVVKCAISLFNSCFSNVTKQVAPFYRTFYGNIFFCDLWRFYIGGGGQKEVPHKRQSPDLGTLEVESIEICSIEIRIARKKKNKSQQKLWIFFKLDINHFYLPKLQLYKFICDDLHLLINQG